MEQQLADKDGAGKAMEPKKQWKLAPMSASPAN